MILIALCSALANPLEGVQVYQNIGQGVVVGNGGGVAQLWPLDAQVNSLAVDALCGSTLLENIFELLAGAIDLIAQACSDAGRDGGDAALFEPVLIVDRTGIRSLLWIAQWADIAGALMWNERGFAPEPAA